MGQLRNYLIAVCSAAMLCAIIKQIAGRNKMCSGTVNLLSALFVTICIISPWKDFSLQDLQMYNPLETQSADVYVETGKQMTQNKIETIIIERTQAYILEKANQLHVQVEVRVELSNDGIPLRSVITGNLSQSEKDELSAFLLKEIGIKEEMQIWK